MPDDRPDLLPCPFCAHAEPSLVMIVLEPPAYVVVCPECLASGPKALSGIAKQRAARAWNDRAGA